MAELTTLQSVLGRIGVEADTDDAAQALRLLRAVSAEWRRRSRKAYEGVPTIYRQTIDTGGHGDFVLPHVPVTDLLSVAPMAWDGTLDPIYLPEDGDWSTTIAAPVTAGDTTATLVDDSGVSVGDHMNLGNDEVVRVSSLGPVTFEPAVTVDYAAGDVAKEAIGSASWRITAAARGKVEVAGSYRFYEVVWRVSGDVPAEVSQAVEDWCAARWDERERSPGLTSYATGDDEEDYEATLAGAPPASASRLLLGEWHPSKNGVV